MVMSRKSREYENEIKWHNMTTIYCCCRFWRWWCRSAGVPSIMTRQETSYFLYKISALKICILYKSGISTIRQCIDEFNLAGSISRFYVFSSFFLSSFYFRHVSAHVLADYVKRLKDKLYTRLLDIDDKYIYYVHVKSWVRQLLQHLINLQIDAVFFLNKKDVIFVIAV